MASEFEPARFHVFCSVPTTDPRSKTGLYTFRVGVTNDREKIAGIIADDRKNAANTFGGLIAKPDRKRTYSVFEAAWTKPDMNAA